MTPASQAVGSGIKGGVLVKGPDGKVTEQQVSRVDAPIDKSRASFVSSGGGGGSSSRSSSTPTVAEQSAQQSLVPELRSQPQSPAPRTLSPQQRGLGGAPGLVGKPERIPVSAQVRTILNSDNPVEVATRTATTYGRRFLDSTQGSSTAIAGALKRSGEVQAREGTKQFFGGRQDLKPYESKGTGIVTSSQPLTEEELLTLPFGGGETEYVRRKEREIQQVQNVETEKAVKELQPRYEEDIASYASSLQQLVDAGAIDPEQANEQLEAYVAQSEQKLNAEIEQRVNPIVLEQLDSTNKQLREAARRRQIGEAAVLAPSELLVNAGLGFAGGAAGAALRGGRAAGTVAALLTGASAASAAPQISKAIESKDFFGLGAAGISIAASSAGSYVGAKIGTRMVERPIIDAAIARAEVQSKVVANDFDAALAKYTFDKAGEVELQKMLDRGMSIRVIESKLVPKSTADAELLPKVSSHVLEVVDRNGQVVQRVGLGQFVAETKNARYSADVLLRSVGKIEGESGTYYTEVFEGRLKDRTFRPVQETELLEQSTVKSVERDTEISRLLYGESSSRVLSTKKVRGAVDVNDEFSDMIHGSKPSEDDVMQLLAGQSKRPSRPGTRSESVVREKLKEFEQQDIPLSIEENGVEAFFGGFKASARETISKGLAATRLPQPPRPKRSRPSTFTDMIAAGPESTRPQVQEQTSQNPLTQFAESGVSTVMKLFTRRVVSSEGGSRRTILGFSETRSPQKQSSAVSSLIGPVDLQSESVRERSRQRGEEVQLLSFSTATATQSGSSERAGSSTKELFVSAETQRVAQAQRQDVGLRQTQVQSPRVTTTTVRPQTPRPKTPDVPTLFVPSGEDEASRTERGYRVQAKVSGQFVDLLGGRAVTKQSAASAGVGFTDVNLSRTFRLVPTNLKVKSEKPGTIAGLQKYRQFEQRGGQRRFTPTQFIERSKYALEKQESRAIQSVRARATPKGLRGVFGI